MTDDNQVTSPIAGAEIIDEQGENVSIAEEGAREETQEVDESLTQASNQTFDPEVFEATKNLIIRKLVQVEELKKEASELSESLKNILTNDSTLADLEEKQKETRVEVQKRKRDLNNSPASQSIKTKLMETKEELRDAEDSLSNQLLNLYQMTGVQEFETPSGEVREFVVKAKVKAKKGK